MKMEGCPNPEKRRFSRFKDNIFIFGNLKPSPTEEFKAVTEDISAGGLMFETAKDIRKGCQLGIEIYHPINRDKTIIFSVPVLAKVIWIEKIEKDNFELGENKYRVGIKFLRIKGEDRQRIAKYVEENRAEK